MSSANIPNYEIIRNDALLSLAKEFDIDKSLGRYASVNPELIKLCESMGLTDENGQTIMKVQSEDVDYRVALYYSSGLTE